VHGVRVRVLVSTDGHTHNHTQHTPLDHTCDDDVEVLWVADELHRGVVDVHVAQLHVGVVRAHTSDHLLPQLADLLWCDVCDVCVCVDMCDARNVCVCGKGDVYV
jgi:hypothetical protein